MHVVRLIVVSLLILAILFAYGLQARGELSQSWRDVRPGVIEVMDGLYAVIRNFVAGSDLEDGIDDDTPVNFDEVITRDRGSFLIN